MKRAIYLIIAAVCLCGCRMNNGNIGDFFGSWLLYSLTIDGVEDPDFNPETTFWEFQNDIIDISIVNDRYDKSDHWGTWIETDGALYLCFKHYDYNHPTFDCNIGEYGIYGVPTWLYFPADGNLKLTIREQSSKRMVLQWTDPEDHTIVYSLRKLW